MEVDNGGRGGANVPDALNLLAAYAWRLLVIAAAAVVLTYVLITLRLVILPVVTALFLATLLVPLVERLRRRGFKPGIATTIVFVGSLLLLAGLVSVLVPQVSSQVGEMSDAVQQGADRALNYLSTGPFQLSEEQIQSFVEDAATQIRENRAEIASGVISGAAKVGEFITGMILTFFLLFFFLKDGVAMWGWFVGQFGDRNRAHLDNIGGRVWVTMGAYLRGIATIGLIEGTAIGIVLAILGVPLLIPLVLLQFFAAFFPVVGALVAGIIATLVALVSGGVADALIVGISILVIQQADNHLLQPLIMGRAVSLHPVVVLLALAAGGVAAGIIGALLAVPLMAVASTVCGYFNSLRAQSTPSFAALKRGRSTNAPPSP